MIDFSRMTNAQLKEYAKENNINVSGASNKTELIAKITGLEIGSFKLEAENVIGSIRAESVNVEPESSTVSNENNVVSSRPAEKSFNKILPQEQKKTDDKIILYSEKNLHWQEAGTLKIGYNIVTKEASEKWLSLGSGKGVREATPEEVATHYGL